MSPKTRLGDEERRLMHLVPAPAVRLMKRRVLSRPGVNSLMVLIFHTPGLHSSFHRSSSFMVLAVHLFSVFLPRPPLSFFSAREKEKRTGRWEEGGD